MVVKRSRGLKIIKKTGKVLAWIFGVLLVLVIGGYFALKSPAAQTWMAQRAADYMSKELKTKITIRAVNIEFFKKVNLEGIYVEDQHGDTLLYAENLKADIHNFNYENHYISVNNITLSDSKIKLKKYKGEKGLSYRFIEKYFQSSDTTTKKSDSPWKVELGGIVLDNVVFAYIDTRDTENDPGMDYENIRVTGIKGTFTDINPMGDSVSLRIKGLSGTERCGLALKDFSTRITVSDKFAHLDNLHFITPGSAVDGFISFYFDSPDDFADDFIHLVKMDGHFTNSVIELGDIAYFAPELLGIKKKVLLTGDIKGTVDHLKCKNVDLQFGERSHIAGNFSFNGLPNIEETDMNFKIREAVTNRKDLEGIPIAPFGKNDHLVVDENIGKLGDVRFSGSAEGFVNDFVALGTLNTALGSITMKNVSMSRESDSLEYRYAGLILANHFNVGSFYDIPDLSFVSANVNIKGVGLSQQSINAQIDGHISELVYRNYPYQNIEVTNGKLRRQVFNGDFDLDDPNVRMVFSGEVDNSTPIPHLHFDARIDSANLGELGFLDKANEYLLSADVHTDFTGDNIDNLNGQLTVDNLVYIKNGGKYSFNTFNLLAGTSKDSTRRLSLTSDIVWVNLEGKFKLMEMPHAISDLMSTYLPSYFPADTHDKKKTVQQFNWSVIFQNNTKPIQALVPELSIAPNTVFRGNFDLAKNSFSTTFISPSIVYKDIYYNGINLSADNKRNNGMASLSASVEELKITDTIGTKNMQLDINAVNDSLLSHLSWDNKSVKKNDANVFAMLHFENQQAFELSFLSTNMFKTQLHLNDSLWTVAPGNFIRLDSNRITFHDLVFHSGSQSIGFNGLVSPKPTDQLNVSMKDFNVAYLNYFTVPKGITISGTISSQTGLSDLYETVIFTSNTDFKSFVINGQKLGDGELDAVWQKSENAVYMHGHFSKGIINEGTGQPIDNIIFDGHYYPKKKENSLDINSSFVNIPLAALQPLLKDFCSVMVGQIDGGLHITGTPSKPVMNGKMDVNFRLVRVDYLGLDLRSSVQPVYIEENSFFFDDYKVTDAYSDTAKIYGHLFHDNFSNFQFDMDFAFDHFMVLNTTANQNELYYGKVFASGYMNVFGYVDDIVNIDMNAKTEKIVRGGQPIYSEFNIPMSTTSEVNTSASDFITFVDHSNTSGPTKGQGLKNNGLKLHMNIQATNDAFVKVVFDKTVGDELTAYGNGDLILDISPSGDFTIFGQYEVENGNYLFTMKNVILVPFDLAEGGTISWNGDPYDAQIDADAVYKTNTSVEPFFPTDSTNQAYHRSYPVDVVMHLDNKLMNPDVSFDINLPTADQNIQETVKSYTQAELEKNRQVLSLMVLNSFVTPSELRDGTDAATTNVAGGTSATLLSNFVSGTMNNWLSQISSDFHTEVKYRPNDDLTTQELKVYLGTQLMNNRITVDVAGGKINANQATSSNSNGQWVGDLNVEYKVTDDGRVRLRAFNRSNDNTVLVQSSPYTQGVGVFYREEFESGQQLRGRYKRYFNSENPNRKKKLDMQQQQTPTTPPATGPSTQTVPAADTTAH